MRVMGREPTLHSSFAAMLQGDVFTTLITDLDQDFLRGSADGDDAVFGDEVVERRVV